MWTLRLSTVATAHVSAARRTHHKIFARDVPLIGSSQAYVVLETPLPGLWARVRPMAKARVSVLSMVLVLLVGFEGGVLLVGWL